MYSRGAVVPSDGYHAPDLKLHSLSGVRHEGVGAEGRALQPRRLYLAEAAIRFAEQLPAVQRHVAHCKHTGRERKSRRIVRFSASVFFFVPSSLLPLARAARAILRGALAPARGKTLKSRERERERTA